MADTIQHTSGSLQALDTIVGVLSVPTETIVGTVTIPITPSKYTGEYEFTPSSETQEIQIEGEIATQNIIINPIPSNYGLITWNGSVLTVS